jgi:hypothetical protein
MSYSIGKSGRRARNLLALGVLVIVSCDNPLEVSDCPDQVQITMSAGTTPEIDWTPRCHLSGLTVSTYGDLNVWIIHSPPQYIVCSDYGGGCNTQLNTLYPPIRFGVLPRDAFQDLPPPNEQARPLNVGWPYAVRLDRAGRPTPFAAVDTFVVSASAAR